MKVIVDTNIIIGALVKRSFLLFKFLRICRYVKLLSPDFLKEELLSKVDKISRLSKLSKQEVEFAISVLTEYIDIIPKKEYEDKIEEAKEIAKNFDYNDFPFIALALKLSVPIWTNDKSMIKYGLVSDKFLALDTEALEMLIIGKNLEEIKGHLKKKYF